MRWASRTRLFKRPCASKQPSSSPRSSPTMLRHAFPLLSPSRYTPLLPKRPFRIPSHRYSSPSSTPSFSPSSISLSSRFLSSSSPPPPPPSPPPTPPSNDDRDPSKSLHVKKQQLKELQAKGQQRLQSGLTTVRSSPALLAHPVVHDADPTLR
jgi:hypothetical protein